MHIINVYRMASRARRYLTTSGMEGKPLPLPLSVRDISDVLDAWASPLSREELDPCVFALDAEDRSSD